MKAGDLTPGHTLRTADGTTATIQDVRQRQRTHDLTINDIQRGMLQGQDDTNLLRSVFEPR